MAEINQQLLEEESLANELALEQEVYAAQQELQNIASEGKSYGHPSYIKYFILFSLAVIVDVVDFADLSALLAILARFFSFFAWIGMLLIYWFTDTKQKNAEKYVQDVEARVANVQLAIARGTKSALRTAKLLRKVPGMKGVARQIPRMLVKIRRVARKNPITKIAVGGALNLFPFLAIFPWMFFGVLWTYLDEKKTYKNASESGEEIVSQNITDMA